MVDDEHIQADGSEATDSTELREDCHIHQHHQPVTTDTMTFPTAPLFLQAMRYYSHRAGPSRADRFGAVAAVGYCCIAFSAPFAGAAVVSRKAQKDKRYANM